jgi:hypothetical protein
MSGEETASLLEAGHVEMQKTIAYRLTLPETLDSATQFGIQRLIDSYVHRVGDAASLVDEAVVKDTRSESLSELPAAVARRAEVDDVSSVGQDGISVGWHVRQPSPVRGAIPVQRCGRIRPRPRELEEGVGKEESVNVASAPSEVTGQGRAALRTLLESTRYHKTPPIAAIRKRCDFLRNRSNDFFLLMDEDVVSMPESGHESDLSSVSPSSGDEVSVATSAIGQTALRALLSSVDDGQPRRKKYVAKGRKRKEGPMVEKSLVEAETRGKKQRKKQPQRKSPS